MGLHTLLHRRGAIYYFRQRIPLELIPCVGKAELRFSLATADAKIALKRLKIISAQLSEQFDSLRTGNISELQLDFLHQPHKKSLMSKAISAASANDIRLDSLFAEWKQSHIDAGNSKSASTYSEWELAIRQFKELNGDLPVKTITKTHIKGFRTALLKIPGRHSSDKTLPEIVDMVMRGELKGEKLSPHRQSFLEDDA